MLTEFFYPEELKRIVAELRHKKDLNKKPVYSLNRGFLFIVIIFPALISYLPFYKGYYFDTVACFVFFSVIGYYLYFLPLVDFMIIPYSAGNNILGTVISSMALRNKSLKRWQVEYVFEGNGKKIQGKTDIYLDLNMGLYIPQKHDDVIIYFNPSNPKKNTLFIPNYFKKYCLSKSVLENTSY